MIDFLISNSGPALVAYAGLCGALVLIAYRVAAKFAARRPESPAAAPGFRVSPDVAGYMARHEQGASRALWRRLRRGPVELDELARDLLEDSAATRLCVHYGAEPPAHVFTTDLEVILRRLRNII